MSRDLEVMRLKVLVDLMELRMELAFSSPALTARVGLEVEDPWDSERVEAPRPGAAAEVDE